MILIDAHIHIHDCFDLKFFLNSTKKNFIAQNRKLNLDSSQSVLCLTESYNVNYFQKLNQFAKKKETIGPWQIISTHNKNTLCLQDQDNFKIFLIAGRQIVTKENLEVLALGLNEIPEDGKPIKEVIEYVHEKKSIAVIPWGVGKWFGKRKEIVQKIVMQNNTYPIYLGDNGNRPFFWRKPKIFDLAYTNEVLNIPGSDPLPFNREEKRSGSFGLLIADELNAKNPFDSIYRILSNMESQPRTYGNLESFLKFFKHQVGMQIVKRIRK